MSTQSKTFTTTSTDSDLSRMYGLQENLVRHCTYLKSILKLNSRILLAGFAFVEFNHERDARDACDELNDKYERKN